jgi:hypothetical protein
MPRKDGNVRHARLSKGERRRRARARRAARTPPVQPRHPASTHPRHQPRPEEIP